MVIVFAGAVMAAIGSSEKKSAINGHDHEGHAHEGGEDGHNHGRLGPHGGKILTEESFELEVVIDETGDSPHFRLYPSCNHKPVNPGEVTAEIHADRLGDKTAAFHFLPVSDFLVSSEPVDLPHSFFLKVNAEWKKEAFEWEFSQYDGRLTLASEIAERMGLISETAAPGVIKSTIQLPGEVTFDADKLSHVVPRVPGVVMEVIKNLGDRVNKDEIIALIDSRELGEARSKYLVALEREKLAGYNFERAERLYKIEAVPEKEQLTARKAYLEEMIERKSAARKLMTMGMTEKEIEGLESGSNADLTRYAIRAPFDGVVVKKHIAPGEWVKEDAEIFIVADLKEVWVEITVYTGDLNSVYVGQKALVKSESAGLEAIAGEVFVRRTDNGRRKPNRQGQGSYSQR